MIALQVAPTKDYTSVLVTIAIFLLVNIGTWLVAWGSTRERLRSIQEKMVDLPSKAEMQLAVANLKAELLLVMDGKLQSKDQGRRAGDGRASAE